jgi:hypothetical protein
LSVNSGQNCFIKSTPDLPAGRGRPQPGLLLQDDGKHELRVSLLNTHFFSWARIQKPDVVFSFRHPGMTLCTKVSSFIPGYEAAFITLVSWVRNYLLRYESMYLGMNL